MTDIEELKKQLREHDDERLYHEADVLMTDAADAIEQLQRQLENEKIESATLRHGHRIASDNCVRLERELEEARKDAERYRLIRDRWHVQFKEGALQNLNCVVSEKWGARLDGDLDAIMQGRPTSVDAARQQQG